MADYPQTGSILTNSGGNINQLSAGSYGQNFNRTGISLSTMILIQVGETPVGAIQEISINETRPIRVIGEVGTDGIIDSAPQKYAEFRGNCNRIRFDRLRIAEAFGRGFTHVHAQRIPFDITITDFFGYSPSAGQDAKIVTVIKNVWISGINYTYSASEYIVSDRMEFVAEAIFSQLAVGGGNVATGGARDLDIAVDPIEQMADRGLRRGSLDAPGLLNAVYQS